MEQKITSEEVLDYLGKYLQFSLAEVEEHTEKNNDRFLIGQYYAFVECLEIITIFWDKARLYGLDFAPEDRYKLELIEFGINRP